MSSFQPPQVIKCPPILEGIATEPTPYSQLDSLWDRSNVTGVVVNLLKQATEANRIANRGMVVVPDSTGSFNQDVLKSATPQFLEVMRPPDRFLAVSRSGNRLYEGQFVAGSKPNVSIVARADRSPPDPLERLDTETGSVWNSHLQNLGALLRPERGQVILEAGAGRATGRLNFLNETCQRAGATYIAMDALPIIAGEMQGITGQPPYIATPPYDQFLRPTLDLEVEYSVFAFQNMISTLSADGIAQWLSVADTLKVDRLLFSQTFLMDRENSYWCGNHFLDSRDLLDLVREKADGLVRPTARRRGPNCTSDEILNLAYLAAAHATVGLANALVSQHIIQRAKECTGFYYHRIIHETSVAYLEGDAKAKSIARLSKQEQEVYGLGLFNSISSGPFGAGPQFELKKGVEANVLRVEITNLHLELSRVPFSNDLPIAAEGTTLSPGSLADFVCAPSKPILTKIDQRAACNQVYVGTRGKELVSAGFRAAWEYHRDILGGGPISSPFLLPIMNNLGEIYNASLERITTQWKD